MREGYNFSAGPSVLPEPVLMRIKEDIPNWHDGMTAMEVSHRGGAFTEIVERTDAQLRRLLSLPKDYHILYMQGGATLQFSAVPMNLLNGKSCADYILTGMWSEKAAKEAKRYTQVGTVCDGKQTDYHAIPDAATWQYNENAAYCHITPNETINGVEFHAAPRDCPTPLVADMSSTLLSRPIDIAPYDVIYAGTQKNIAPAGLTLVIVHERCLETTAHPATPSLLDYRVLQQARSLYNTPPTFSWYVASLVLSWLEELGGLSVIGQLNASKQKKLYDYIDASALYHNPVSPACRSWMNVPFILTESAQDERFLQFAQAQGLYNLKGHRQVGGMRASIYNAMPMDGVDALIAVMKHFEQTVV